MARTVRIQGEVVFPPRCVVCLAEAKNRFPIERVFSYGRRGVEARVEAPLCDKHFVLAASKSRAERLVGRGGLWLGAAAGLAAAGALLEHWNRSQQGSLIPNLFLALVVGVGIFLVVWLSIFYWLAPRFADPQARRARAAVRILRYWPGDQLMELEIENDAAAGLLEKLE